MTAHHEFMFGALSTVLYVVWGVAALNSPEPNRAFMLWFYACANVAILWPVIRRVF